MILNADVAIENLIAADRAVGLCKDSGINIIRDGAILYQTVPTQYIDAIIIVLRPDVDDAAIVHHIKPPMPKFHPRTVPFRISAFAALVKRIP